jgi:uroporphyrinogen-III decarboxylase
MVELAHETKLTFNGKPGRIRVGLKEMTGPFTTCIDLVGPDVFWWVYEYPEAVKKLLDKVVAGYIDWITHSREVTGNPGKVMYSGGDGSSLLSEAQNREFIVERYKRIWAIHHGERLFHMCGKMGHLLPILRDEYHIDELWGFGHQVSAEEVGRELGGHCRLLGNLDPMLIHDGPVEKIREATLSCIETLAPYGGYSACLGYNLPPGTPMEHVRAMVEAAEEYGRPKVTRGPIASGDRQPPQNPRLERHFH